jgi:hypothetical protein
MKSDIDIKMREGERGAVKIQTILTFVLIGIVAFVIIKIAPIYIEERSIRNEVSELARIASVRNIPRPGVEKAVQEILGNYKLGAGSITVVLREEDKTRLVVKYNRPIDFLVTQWDWKVEYTADGKAL